MLHLVLHQGDERCDDDTGALLGQRRHLEGDALATAGRHQSEGVLTRADALYDFPLYAAEVVIVPVLLENLSV